MKIRRRVRLCIILLTMFAGDRGLPAVFKARRQAHALAREIARAARRRTPALRGRAPRAADDPGTIEAVARETLGLARADELVVLRRR